MSTLALTPRPAAVAPQSSTRAWLGFLVVLSAVVMNLLDSTITQTAGPAIRRDLGGSYADLEWITAGYTLAVSASLLLGSRLGDAFWRRRVLLARRGCFVLVSVLCALPPSPVAVITARAPPCG